MRVKLKIGDFRSDEKKLDNKLMVALSEEVPASLIRGRAISKEPALFAHSACFPMLRRRAILRRWQFDRLVFFPNWMVAPELVVCVWLEIGDDVILFAPNPDEFEQDSRFWLRQTGGNLPHTSFGSRELA
jgi:hypothetical protein